MACIQQGRLLMNHGERFLCKRTIAGALQPRPRQSHPTPPPRRTVHTTAPPTRSHIHQRPLLHRPSARRTFSQTTIRPHGDLDPPKPGEELYINLIEKDGNRRRIAVAEGDNLLDVCITHDIEMEGACGGSCACSTCHVYLDEKTFDTLGEASEEEEDMLGSAFGLQQTSRLACQIKMAREIDGMTAKLPSSTRNLSASDFSSATKGGTGGKDSTSRL